MKDINLICRLNKDWRADNIKIKKAGGQTNRNYIVQHESKKFFVRLPWETSVINRKIEGKNILALSRNKKLQEILPKYYIYILKGKNILSPQKEKFNLPDGTMVTEYIEGKDINGKDLENPKIQNALLKCLRVFHTSGVKFVNDYDVFRDEVSKYKNKAKKYPINKLIKIEEIEKIEKIESEAKKKLVLGGGISTHNDLIFENLRLGENGRVYLLDFEYGGFNVRSGLYYDLGIILGGNLFQKIPIKIETFEDILKKAFQIYKNKLDKNKIYYGALTNILVMFWWGLVKYFSSNNKKEKKYFRKYVLDRVKGIEYLYEIARNK